MSQVTVSFADPLWFAMYHDRGSQKRCNKNLASLPWISKNLTFAEESCPSTFDLKIFLKCCGFVRTCVAPTLEHDKLSLLQNLNRKKCLFTCGSVYNFV